ncbi:MAG: hypothetical protein GX442_26380 [Candidatus Riflebacteria bacterium]|nr:hypothetical protein [Candidatus Riflebacteria bacterium]
MPEMFGQVEQDGRLPWGDLAESPGLGSLPLQGALGQGRNGGFRTAQPPGAVTVFGNRAHQLSQNLFQVVSVDPYEPARAFERAFPPAATGSAGFLPGQDPRENHFLGKPMRESPTGTNLAVTHRNLPKGFEVFNEPLVVARGKDDGNFLPMFEEVKGPFFQSPDRPPGVLPESVEAFFPCTPSRKTLKKTL